MSDPGPLHAMTVVNLAVSALLGWLGVGWLTAGVWVFLRVHAVSICKRCHNDLLVSAMCYICTGQRQLRCNAVLMHWALKHYYYYYYA
jgi:hypothetical protein